MPDKKSSLFLRKRLLFCWASLFIFGRSYFDSALGKWFFLLKSFEYLPIIDFGVGTQINYRTSVIITSGLYKLFYSISHCGLYCKSVNFTDNLSTKQGNTSIFEPKIRGLLSRAVSDQEGVILTRVRYICATYVCTA